MRVCLVFVLMILAACKPSGVDSSKPNSTSIPASVGASNDGPALGLPAGIQAFFRAVARVEPVAERMCAQANEGLNCDFKILLDDNPRKPPNAFQTLERSGRPVILFTASLLARAHNDDEIAFVLGHEAAHHIENHLARQRTNAMAGAVLLGNLATLTGVGAIAVQTAQELGAAVGARSYSKDFELEADRLGAVITARAGYDSLLGSAFFTRIPDPGDRFLGTHPPNADRVKAVRDAAAKL
jgi:predicted Zn-dependent protease